MPDSKPVHEAVKLINQGKFSTSARMSSFLNNVNWVKLESKHISGKAKLNPLSDSQSRSPAECKAELCAIHRFIQEQINGDLEQNAKYCALKTDETIMASREAWRKAQASNQACSVASKLLKSGKPPPKAVGKHAGDYWNDIRKYCRDASIAADGTLVVKTPPELQSGDIERERVVIPKILVPALLYHMHNHLDKHPAKAQQKAMFQRKFYAIALDKQLDLLYENCYRCAVVQQLPKEIIPNETKTEAAHPHSHFHADVIRRAKQYILMLRDHFSSFQDAILIKSEKADDLRDGIVMLTTAVRKPSKIYITVDNSPGFNSLITNKDKALEKLMIQLIGTDCINKNANAMADKGCKELEEELKRLDPEGKQISISTLKLAIVNLNSRLRRKGHISAYEIHTARDQETNENLQLNDGALRNNQLQSRLQLVTPGDHQVEEGDTVKIKNKSDKHKANDMFIITKKSGDTVNMQKLIHPLDMQPTKLTSKVYVTNQKYVSTIHRPIISRSDTHEEDHENDQYTSSTKLKTNNNKAYHYWSPINPQFFQAEDDSDDETSEVNTKKITPYRESKVEDDSEDIDALWDHSPEQYQLATSTDDISEAFQDLMLPKPIFHNESAHSQNSISSEDEVFMRDTPSLPTNVKLQRRNAIRRNKNATEPRVTRQKLLNLNTKETRSQPTTPRRINLQHCQNLEEHLRPRHPITNEVVNLDQVQNLHNVLPSMTRKKR